MSENFIMFHVHDPKLAIEEAYLKCDKIKNKTHWKMLGRSLKWAIFFQQMRRSYYIIMLGFWTIQG